MVLVIFCILNAAVRRLRLGCPGCVATPYLIRLYRSLRRARPIEGGFMVWPSGQSPCEAKISGPCTCSTSFSKSRSQHTFAKSTWVSSVATPTAGYGTPMSGQTKSWLCVAVRVRTMYSSKICRRLLCVVINEQQYSVGTQGIRSGGQYSFDLYCKLYYIKRNPVGRHRAT